jgi:very-short-patch-repair endonuclease
VRGPSTTIEVDEAYGAKLTGIARGLRQRQTSAEAKLWAHLRNRQLGDLKFRRQVPRGRFVADFLCDEAMLILEIDGAGHETKLGDDQERTAYLESLGYMVLRFMNWDVRQNTHRVLDHIYEVAVSRKKAPSSGPPGHLLPKGRRVAGARRVGGEGQ